ncbi:alkyl sulfatase dimerization domain-containing protein [Photorhabdus heterorhabditis]|uniref:alkyl sulfatase dimerization domain-containing protein n=1 Tax=Photorhabdus heterorhabditis TaxID=880156 RepID=UPI003BB4B4FF
MTRFFNLRDSLQSRCILKSIGYKYMEYMGGEDALIKRAQADFDKGEYRCFHSDSTL